MLFHKVSNLVQLTANVKGILMQRGNAALILWPLTNLVRRIVAAKSIVELTLEINPTISVYAVDTLVFTRSKIFGTKFGIQILMGV